MTDVITDKGCQDARRGRGGAGRVGPGAGRAVGGSARSQGLRLTGEDGLLAQLTKTIIESAAEGEMDDISAPPSTIRLAATGSSASIWRS